MAFPKRSLELCDAWPCRLRRRFILPAVCILRPVIPCVLLDSRRRLRGVNLPAGRRKGQAFAANVKERHQRREQRFENSALVNALSARMVFSTAASSSSTGCDGRRCRRAAPR